MTCDIHYCICKQLNMSFSGWGGLLGDAFNKRRVNYLYMRSKNSKTDKMKLV